MKLRIGCVVVGFLLFVLSLAAQTPSSGSASSSVPPLVNFNGVLADSNGKPLTGTVGVTFYLYQDQQGGAPLWLETQNVQADKTGHYSVALGSATSQGLPASVFASGEARWLGVEVHGRTEQPRVLLVSVPYALKALDAETIGGKPASAFMMAPASNSKSQSPILPPGTITGSGTADFVPYSPGHHDWELQDFPNRRGRRRNWNDYTSRHTRRQRHGRPSATLSLCFPSRPIRACRFMALPSRSAARAW